MKPTGLLQAALVLAFALLAYGSVSEHWFVEAGPPLLVHEGVMSSEICGVGVGRGVDELEEFGKAQAAGLPPPPPQWTCERTFHATLVGKIRKLGHFLFWFVDLLCVVAGLASAGLLIAGLLGRRRVSRYLTVSSAIALGAAFGAIGLAIVAGEYGLSNLGLGAGAYVAGGLLALWSSRQLRTR